MQVPSGLKISYSGVRGIYGESLTPQVAYGFGQAFRQFLKKEFTNPLILIARDTRSSGEKLKNALIAGLLTFNCEIKNLGIIPTPTLQQAISDFKAQAAVMITASHNPDEWNGFKFFKAPDDIILSSGQMEELFTRYQKIPPAKIAKKTLKENLTSQAGQQAEELHLEKLLSYVDLGLIAGKKFKVILDSGLGSGQRLGIKLLESLGCRLKVLRVKRPSEPLPQNLKKLCRAVKAENADLGFAQDLDADRLAIVSEKAKAVGEEYTLALVVRHLLEKYKVVHPVVVRNSTTTHLIDRLVKNFGGELFETRVGEINLSLALADFLKQRRLAFGGEGNGGIIFPPISLGRDSFIGMAFVLEYLAKREKKLSELVKEFPPFYQQKLKIPVLPGEKIENYFTRIKLAFPQALENQIDGSKLIFKDQSWLSLRASNTEPILRLTSESQSRQKAMALLKKALSAINVGDSQ